MLKEKAHHQKCALESSSCGAQGQSPGRMTPVRGWYKRPVIKGERHPQALMRSGAERKGYESSEKGEVRRGSEKTSWRRRGCIRLGRMEMYGGISLWARKHETAVDPIGLKLRTCGKDGDVKDPVRKGLECEA